MYSNLRSGPKGMLTVARTYLSRLLIEEHSCFPPEHGQWHSVARQLDRASDYSCPECGQRWHNNGAPLSLRHGSQDALA
jgi:hypothetical protein